jgi:hypothetical protein
MGSWLYELIQNLFENGNFELIMLQNNRLIEVNASWLSFLLKNIFMMIAPNWRPDPIVVKYL